MSYLTIRRRIILIPLTCPRTSSYPEQLSSLLQAPTNAEMENMCWMNEYILAKAQDHVSQHEKVSIVYHAMSNFILEKVVQL